MTNGCYVGIDVGGTSVRVGAEECSGHRSEIASAFTPRSYGQLLLVIRRLAEQVATGPVLAASCGIPGTTDGVQARFVPALPFVEGAPMGTDLAAALGGPTTLSNDAQLALLGEVQEGAARHCQSAVLVSVGTGIGGAIMVEGRIWPGYHGSAGSWGWLPASCDPDEVHGPYEKVASGKALSAIAAALAPGSDGPDLIEAARRGEPGPQSAVRSYAEHLGRGIAAIASVIDPEVVLVGGGLSEAMDVLGPLVEDCCRKFASPDGRKVPVRATALGRHAGVIGALWAAARSGLSLPQQTNQPKRRHQP
jgi:predicted NBD/HSP70 family sugar kinase